MLQLTSRPVHAKAKGKRDMANGVNAYWKGAVFYKKN